MYMYILEMNANSAMFLHTITKNPQVYQHACIVCKKHTQHEQFFLNLHELNSLII